MVHLFRAVRDKSQYNISLFLFVCLWLTCLPGFLVTPNQFGLLNLKLFVRLFFSQNNYNTFFRGDLIS